MSICQSGMLRCQTWSKVCFDIRNILPVSPDIYRQQAGNFEKFSNETNQSHSLLISRHKGLHLNNYHFLLKFSNFGKTWVDTNVPKIWFGYFFTTYISAFVSSIQCIGISVKVLVMVICQLMSNQRHKDDPSSFSNQWES